MSSSDGRQFGRDIRQEGRTGTQESRQESRQESAYNRGRRGVEMARESARIDREREQRRREAGPLSLGQGLSQTGERPSSGPYDHGAYRVSEPQQDPLEIARERENVIRNRIKHQEQEKLQNIRESFISLNNKIDKAFSNYHSNKDIEEFRKFYTELIERTQQLYT